ncbi:MAG: hypothetical protein WCV84_00745 [Patescibacteria group bacterium]
MKRVISTLCLAAIISTLITPFPTLARTLAFSDLDTGFNPHTVLEDRDIFDLGVMNQESIQKFLDAKGTLGLKALRDIDGNDKPAAEIIWRVSTSYKINPRYLLALIQKEQSLVEDTTPTQKQLDWAAGYGVCDDCSMNDPRIQDYKGFANQLEYAAKQHRERYLMQMLGKGTTISGYAPGKQMWVDGLPIIPTNQATAMLYSYTPHVSGNQNLWRIWKRWFSLVYPDNSIVKGKSSNVVYLLKNGKRHKIENMAVAASMVDTSKILTVEDGNITGYADGKPIKFPNYSIVETDAGDRYLLVGKAKRHFSSKAVFRKLGFNEDELFEATVAELEEYEEGPDIVSASSFPLGLLAKDPTGAYWYLEDGIRHAIPHASFLSLYFKGRPARALTKTKLATYKLGEPYALHDGELVRSTSDNAVYVIENGERRPFPSAAVFEELAYNWKNVVTLPAKLLKEYPTGMPIDPHSPVRVEPLFALDATTSTTQTTTTLAAFPAFH